MTFMKEPKAIWFPAKKYGWGWGLPCTWQGWLVFIVYLLGNLIVLFAFDPGQQPILFGFSLFLLTMVLLVICWLKGEKPKWRWGK